MTYYLKHLFLLYVSYMRLAFIGLVGSSVLLVGYEIYNASNLLMGLLVVMGSLGLLFGLIKVQKYLVRARNESEKFELKELKEQKRLEIRIKQNLARARTFLDSRYAPVEDFEEARLVHEVAHLIDQLDRLEANKVVIGKAVEQFLDSQENLSDKSSLSFLREQVFDDFKRLLLTNLSKKKKNLATPSEAPSKNRKEEDTKVAR